MILVRDVFQLHFGKMRDALALMRQMQDIERRAGYTVTRVLTDLTGTYYTLIVESTFESLTQYEAALNFDDEWRAVYARFVPLVREGHRELLRVVEDAAPGVGAATVTSSRVAT